jgi:hypothetical protein
LSNIAVEVDENGPGRWCWMIYLFKMGIER